MLRYIFLRILAELCIIRDICAEKCEGFFLLCCIKCTILSKIYIFESMYLVLSAIVHRHIYRYNLLKLCIRSVAFCGCAVHCCSVTSIYYRHTSGIEFCSVFCDLHCNILPVYVHMFCWCLLLLLSK